MYDPGEILQKQLAAEVGKDIIVSHKNGTEVSGKLIEIGTNYVTIKRASGSRKTILTDMIGGWEILDEEPLQEARDGTSQSKPNAVKSHTKQEKTVSDKPPEQLSDAIIFAKEVYERLSSIQKTLAGKIAGASIKLKSPDFTIPVDELKGKASSENKEWLRIKERYMYAAKINELNSKYGRIQPIIGDLTSLIGQVPRSVGLRRHLAYFQFIMGNFQAALNAYQEACFLASAACDLYSVAVLEQTLQPANDALVCYALQQVFIRAAPKDYPDAWYLFLSLLQTSDDQSVLKALYEKRKSALTEADEQYWLPACIYLLQQRGQEQAAAVVTNGILHGQPVTTLLANAITYLPDQLSETFKQCQTQWETARLQFLAPPELAQAAGGTAVKSAQTPVKRPPEIVVPRKKSSPQKPPSQLEGTIIIYKHSRGWGFIRGTDKRDYYFHRSAITDDDLLEQIEALAKETLTADEQIAVAFEAREGLTARDPMNRFAVTISRHREIDTVFEMAVTYANDGEYVKAVTQIKKVIALDASYPKAQELYEKWKEYARMAALPKGSTPFARAKRLQMIERDYEGAIRLFYEAIRQNDRLASAVTDLASLLMQLERPPEAVQVLEQNRSKVSDPQPIDNLLIDAYQKSGNYAQAIALLQRTLTSLGPAATSNKKAHVMWQIAICYFRQEDYLTAERWFRDVLELSPTNKAAQRNLAFCLIKQQRFDEAEQLLTANLPDAQSAELLKALEQARATGQSVQIDEITVDMTLADFSSEISPFARFFLQRSTFEGVPSDHVQENRFTRSDVRLLEELATRLGTRRPRERADYYLSAARIISEHDEWEEEYNQLYKYLCRSFTSRGDAAVIENKPLDSAREWYCEALSVYDGDRSRSRDEQDAVNAVVRFLFATLGRANVPIKQVGFENLSIDENLGKVLRLDAEREKIFDAIAYLVFRSQYASNRILTRLLAIPEFEALALSYLKSKGIVVPGGTGKLRDQREFFALWKELQYRELEKTRTMSLEIRSIARVEITAAFVEESLRRVRAVEPDLYFELDRRRLGELQKILEAMLDLSTQSTFEEQERFCNQIENRCKDLVQEIEANPTSLAVEDLYPITKLIQDKTAAYREELYASSVPQLTLRLPKSMKSYASSANDQRIEVQIVIENRMGSSPAEAVELIVQEDAAFFTVDRQDIKLEGSLRGGEQRIVLVPLRITEHARQSQAFSLPVYAQYRTRSEETQQTPVVGFSINLYPAEQFERIKNPYAVYAQGGIVGDKFMFYGRDELVTNIAEAICTTRLQSKAIIIYGQKRSGKSSILYHLKEQLQQEHDLLVLDLGSIGAVLDTESSVPLLYVILYNILGLLNYAIEDEVNTGRSSLDITFPEDVQFYDHPTPLNLSLIHI